MPPSTTTLWSSNTSVQLNNTIIPTKHIPTDNLEGGEGITMMNNSRGLEDDVMVSLGNVLSSVNIAGSDAERRGSVGGGQGQGGYGAPGSSMGSSPAESWGAAAGGAPAPAG